MTKKQREPETLSEALDNLGRAFADLRFDLIITLPKEIQPVAKRITFWGFAKAYMFVLLVAWLIAGAVGGG